VIKYYLVCLPYWISVDYIFVRLNFKLRYIKSNKYFPIPLADIFVVLIKSIFLFTYYLPQRWGQYGSNIPTYRCLSDKDKYFTHSWQLLLVLSLYLNFILIFMFLNKKLLFHCIFVEWTVQTISKRDCIDSFCLFDGV
jgi:hypothetical protein